MATNGTRTARAHGAGTSKAATQRRSAVAATDTADTQRPRTLAISERGVETGEDFANLMSALMSDVIEGRMSPSVANAACNAGGKLLKMVEMQYRYGTQAEAKAHSLRLASP